MRIGAGHVWLMRDVLVGFTALVNILIHAITMRSHVTFEIIGEIDRPMAAMELPSTLSIGTPTAFGGYYEYHFRFVGEINMYVSLAKSWPSKQAQMKMGIPGILLQKADCRREGSMADKLFSAHESNSGCPARMSGS